MKYFFYCFAILFCINVTTAQHDSIVEPIVIKIPTSSFKTSGDLMLLEIPLKSPKPEIVEDIKPDIKAEFWSNIVYNPYHNETVTFPMQLKFEDTTFASPVSHKKVITSRFGWRRGRPHQGIDIDLVTGDSVYSVLDGIVRFASYSRGHGKTVVVRHYNGLETTYAHLSHIAVKANDTLQKGEYLGKGGNTGNSRGSHLHFVASYNGESIHPEYLFDFSSKNKIRSREIWVTKQWTHARFHNSRRVSKIKVLNTEEDALASLIKTKKIYVVKKGDTLYGIARRNNLPISTICNSNAIKKTATLKIGQELILEL